MKRNHQFLFILLFIISIFMGIQEVKANPVSEGTDYTINLLANESNEVCESLLGENLKKDLEQILKIMIIAGPLIIVFLTSMEFISAITGKDDDAIKKCTQKLVTRLVLVVVLFFLPMLINLLLELIDQKYTSCINID